MLTRLRSLEQLMPFATAGELLLQKRQFVVVVAPGTTAVAALREMEEKDIAFLPVVEGGKLVGVVAERDIARGVILHSRTLVRDIMSIHRTMIIKYFMNRRNLNDASKIDLKKSFTHPFLLIARQITQYYFSSAFTLEAGIKAVTSTLDNNVLVQRAGK